MYVSFGAYDPDEEPEDPVEQFLHEGADKDDRLDLHYWLEERTQDEGAQVVAQGKCINCGRVALSFMPLWRWSKSRRRYFAAWTVDGAPCGGCLSYGSIRQLLSQPESQG